MEQLQEKGYLVSLQVVAYLIIVKRSAQKGMKRLCIWQSKFVEGIERRN